MIFTVGREHAPEIVNAEALAAACDGAGGQSCEEMIPRTTCERCMSAEEVEGRNSYLNKNGMNRAGAEDNSSYKV